MAIKLWHLFICKKLKCRSRFKKSYLHILKIVGEKVKTLFKSIVFVLLNKTITKLVF